MHRQKNGGFPEDVAPSQIEDIVNDLYEGKKSTAPRAKAFLKGIKSGKSQEELRDELECTKLSKGIRDILNTHKLEMLLLRMSVLAAACISLVLVCVWTANLVLPERWKWLSHSNQQELTTIVSVIFSYAAATLAKVGIKKKD